MSNSHVVDSFPAMLEPFINLSPSTLPHLTTLDLEITDSTSTKTVLSQLNSSSILRHLTLRMPDPRDRGILAWRDLDGFLDTLVLPSIEQIEIAVKGTQTQVEKAKMFQYLSPCFEKMMKRSNFRLYDPEVDAGVRLFLVINDCILI